MGLPILLKFILMQYKNIFYNFDKTSRSIQGKVGGNMKKKKTYLILILTALMSLIITYGIIEGRIKTYAFTEIFAGNLKAEETFTEAEVFEINTRDIKARLKLKELMYHYEEGVDDHGLRAEETRVSRGAFRFSSQMDMAATAYDLSYESCGKYPDHPEYGITASGTKAKPGTVAVDPDVIALGTKLYIASTDGSPDYGFATALDTGSAIKGYRIDLFMEDSNDVANFGIRQVKVYILE